VPSQRVPPATPVRTLVVVLGDQLDADSSAFDGFDPRADLVFMAEAAEEATHVPSHKARTALFLAAMRRFRDSLRADGRRVDYRALDDPRGEAPTLSSAFADAVRAHRPARAVVVEPGELRVDAALRAAARAVGVPLEIRVDRGFYGTKDAFAAYAAGRRSLRMEDFYREARREHGVLLDGAEPEGGRWNFDAENRAGFGKAGPGDVPRPVGFAPDATVRGVLDLVRRRFPDAPGSLDAFDWPTTPAEAQAALADFVAARLARFGRHQDAMWGGEPYLYHSRLSAAMNLKLLDPRDAVAAAVDAYRAGAADLPAVEGFVRQILGWREFVRGVYWRDMPGLASANYFGHERTLPAWYWTGDTQMACMRETVGQTLEHGYAHHIQRLMVTGNFALLARVLPQDVCAWYLAVYVDAVEWAELPNVAGMALYANGGRFTSKPYAASGQYVKRMSNACAGCRYDPARRTGEDACPMTALFWRFLADHERWLAGQPRTALMAANLARLREGERKDLVRETDALLDRIDRV
jgi:deoxyribodipyrimidine photolyase-related protein